MWLLNSKSRLSVSCSELIPGPAANISLRPILAELPDIVVATPSKALAHLEAQVCEKCIMILKRV
jgi:hypothetical protein